MKDLLIGIIARQMRERAVILRDCTVTRELAGRLRASLNRKLIKAVIGPRRSGKSSLVHQVLSLADEKYAYVNFEDEQLPNELDFDLVDAALDEVYPDSNFYFFDEIQVFPRWEKLLNRLERGGKRIIISGSNSKLLSSELSSSLTGRHELFEMFPFSFKEYSQVAPSDESFAETFTHYMRLGGFPDVVMKRVLPQNYLRELWDSIILKDIVQRYRVRSVTELKALLSLFKDSVSSSLSYRSLERSMSGRLSIATISKFISYAESAYLTFMLPNFSFRARERVNAEKKAYLVDNGFYMSTKVGAQADNGKLLENFVFVTLLRQGFKSGLDLFYYKAKSGKEVDFLTLDHGKPSGLIQVSWSLSSQIALARELSALTECAEELGLTSATIVTLTERAAYTQAGIKMRAIPVEKFLESVDRSR